MNARRIVAVTVTYNAGADLDPFLASFAAQTCPGLRLVIIDNDSRDGTAERLADLSDPRITVLRNDSNVGVAAANNQGIAVALAEGADAVLLINNDTVFGPELVAGLEARLAFPAAAAVSPLIPYHDAPDRIWYAGGKFVRWVGVLNIHEAFGRSVSTIGSQPFPTDYAPTTCLLVDRRVFEIVGPMDEQYFVYCEDADYIWRMRQAGLGILVDPGLVMLHKVSRSTGGPLSPFTIRYTQRNQMLFVRKHFSAPWLGYTIAAVLGRAALGLVQRRRTWRQTVLRMRAMVEGLRMPISPQ